MKINTLLSLCKKEKTFLLFNEYDEKSGIIVRQYISDGGAAYVLDDMPILDEQSVTAVAGIPKEKARGYNVHVREGFPSGMDFGDMDTDDADVYEPSVFVRFGGRDMKPIIVGSQLYWIDARYLSPLLDEMETISLVIRKTDGGRPYIVALNGFVFRAAIFPLRLTERAGETSRAMQEITLLSKKIEALVDTDKPKEEEDDEEAEE